MKKSGQINISLIFAIAAIFSVTVNILQTARYNNAEFMAYGLISSTSFPLLLTATGYFIHNKISSLGKKNMRPWLLPALSCCAVSVGITLFIFFFIQVSAKAVNPAHMLQLLIFIPAKGFPSQLWMLPAVIIGTSVILLLKKFLSLKKITVITAVFYLLATIILNFSLLFPEQIYGIREIFTNIFGINHAGAFSGMLFITLGMLLADKKTFSKKSHYLVGTFISAGCVMAEMLLIKELGGNRSTNFCFSSVFFAYNLTAFASLCPEISFTEERLLNEFGRSFFMTGQLIAGARVFLKNYSASVFAKLFVTEDASIEFILFFALCISLFYCAYKSDSEDVAGVFIHLLQKAVLTIFYLPSVIISKIDDRVKNAVCTVAFAALPVLLWFIERTIKHSLCCDLFFVCLIVILFCSLDRRLTPARVSAGFFGGFLLISVAVYLSSAIYSVAEYKDIGKMMLFFFLPLGIQIAGNKEKITQLLKNYTYGLYISYGIFFFYCACFRPYDITRYKGAFCNANMCGLYLVAVCLAALCNLPEIKSLRDMLKQPLHWLVFGTSFAFTAFTISRTAAVGVAAALAVKFLSEFFAENKILTINKTAVKKAVSSAGLLVIVMSAGLVISYTAIRCIPAIIDNPIFLLVEFTDTFEYKVKPGEGFFSENYISPLRFFEAWFNRSFAGAESINDLSTGRIDIYSQYLKSLTIRGHNVIRLPIETTGEYMYAHNAILQMAYNCGLPVGFGFFGLCIAAIIRAFRKNVRDKKLIIFGTVAIAAYLSCGMFESMECFYYPLLFSALTGLMILAISPAKKDTDADFTIPEFAEASAASVGTASKIDALTVKKFILSAVAIIALVIFIFLLFESRTSQEGMKIFYYYMN